MHQNDLFITLVDFRVLNQAHIGSQASAGTQQVQMLARQQIIHQEGAGGFFADLDVVAGLEVLQA